MSAAISVSGLVKTFGADPRPRRPRPRGRHRRGARLPRPQRLRASRPPSACCSACCAPTPARSGCSDGDPWRDAVALHRRLAYVPGDVTLWPQPHRRRGHRPARPAARRPRPGAGAPSCSSASSSTRRKKARTYSKGNRQKVALVAALASDAELLILDEPTSGLDPLMEAVFQELHPRGRGRGPHGAAVQPHPGRGRGAVRPGQHHPARPHGARPARSAELRHLTRTSIAVETGATGRPASTRCRACTTLAVDGTRVRFDVDTDQLDDVAAAPRRRSASRSLVSHPPTLEELFLRHYGDELAEDGVADPGAGPAVSGRPPWPAPGRWSGSRCAGTGSGCRCGSPSAAGLVASQSASSQTLYESPTALAAYRATIGTQRGRYRLRGAAGGAGHRPGSIAFEISARR